VAVDSERLRKKVESLDGLPTLPSVASSLISMTQSPRTSATDVGELISKDQALTGRVLKLVNSAYYGFPKQITTVNHAVVILGFNRVKNIVLAASVFGMKNEQRPPRFDAPAFWKHSLGSAVASRSLARALNRGEAEDAFVCGLLHDIGKVVLSQVCTKEYERCLELAEISGCLLRDAEEEVLGLDHSEVGAWLAERWKLPPGVQAAIRHHHATGNTRKEREAALITQLGDIFARALQVGSGGDLTIPRIEAGVAADVKLTPDLLDSLVGGFVQDLHNAADFFDMIEES
jgi:putative nucleotidyltransferase with HDIG domain